MSEKGKNRVWCVWEGDRRVDCPVEEEEVNQLGLLKEVTEDVRDFLTVGKINFSHVWE